MHIRIRPTLVHCPILHFSSRQIEQTFIYSCPVFTRTDVPISFDSFYRAACHSELRIPVNPPPPTHTPFPLPPPLPFFLWIRFGQTMPVHLVEAYRVFCQSGFRSRVRATVHEGPKQLGHTRGEPSREASNHSNTPFYRTAKQQSERPSLTVPEASSHLNSHSYWAGNQQSLKHSVLPNRKPAIRKTQSYSTGSQQSLGTVSHTGPETSNHSNTPFYRTAKQQSERPSLTVPELSLIHI